MEKQTTFTYILLWHQNTICEQDFKDSNVFLHVTLTLLILVKLSLTNFEFVNATTYFFFFENFDILTYTVNKWLLAHFSNLFLSYTQCVVVKALVLLIPINILSKCNFLYRNFTYSYLWISRPSDYRHISSAINALDLENLDLWNIDPVYFL